MKIDTLKALATEISRLCANDLIKASVGLAQLGESAVKDGLDERQINESFSQFKAFWRMNQAMLRD